MAMIEDTVGDFNLIVEYECPDYHIMVKHIPTGTYRETKLRSTFEPIFGIDVEDHYYIMQKAEELCVEIENLLNEKS